MQLPGSTPEPAMRGLLDLPWAAFGHSWGLLWSSWVAPHSPWVRLMSSLGALGSLLATLGRSWATWRKRLDARGIFTNPIYVPFMPRAIDKRNIDRVCKDLGASLGALGWLLGPLGSLLGVPWAALGRSWARLGRS